MGMLGHQETYLFFGFQEVPTTKCQMELGRPGIRTHPPNGVRARRNRISCAVITKLNTEYRELLLGITQPSLKTSLKALSLLLPAITMMGAVDMVSAYACQNFQRGTT